MPDRDVSRILQTLARMETTLNAIAQSSEDHERRLRALEGRSGKRWDALMLSVLTSIALGVVGYFLGKR